jgi:hypothetical protein
MSLEVGISIRGSAILLASTVSHFLLLLSIQSFLLLYELFWLAINKATSKSAFSNLLFRWVCFVNRNVFAIVVLPLS